MTDTYADLRAWAERLGPRAIVPVKQARILALLADLAEAQAKAAEWRESLDRLTVQWDDERHKRAEAEDRVEAVRALYSRRQTVRAESWGSGWYDAVAWTDVQRAIGDNSKGST